MARPTTEGKKAPEDVPAEKLNGKTQHAIVEKDSVRRLYAVVLKCRMKRERGGNVAAGAIAHAAATIELTGEDAIAAIRESPALELLFGNSSTSANGGSSSSVPKRIPFLGAGASQLSVAAGVAWGDKTVGKPSVVVALADSASMSVGAAFEALSYAAAHKLPLIVIVDNQGAAGAVRSPDFTALAQGHGVPGFVVDGEDAVAVYRVAREAVHRARAGRGPSLIECRKFSTKEDPLRHLERYLQKHGLWTPRWKRQIVREAQAELRKARR
jgi:TPP-dependent pyruvate/acetoin dehydrogenase alpha subunit